MLHIMYDYCKARFSLSILVTFLKTSTAFTWSICRLEMYNTWELTKHFALLECHFNARTIFLHTEASTHFTLCLYSRANALEGYRSSSRAEKLRKVLCWREEKKKGPTTHRLMWVDHWFMWIFGVNDWDSMSDTLSNVGVLHKTISRSVGLSLTLFVSIKQFLLDIWDILCDKFMWDFQIAVFIL